MVAYLIKIEGYLTEKMQQIRDFFAGFFYLIKGFKRLIDKRLWHFIAAPLLLNICIFIGLYQLAIHFYLEFQHWINHLLPHWLHWLDLFAWAVFFLAYLVVLIYGFTFITNLLGAPFYSFLSEKVEILQGQHHLPALSFGQMIFKLLPYALKQNLRLLFYYLPRAIGCLILCLVPFVSLFATIIWFLFNSWSLNLTYLSYPLENHQFSWSEKKQFVAKRKGLSLGFGVAVTIATMIPLVNLLTMPAAVIGATLIWMDSNISEH